MHDLTLDDLRDMLEAVAGGDDSVWDEATLDKGFDELGYDSLSLVAMVTAFRHDTGVAIAEKLLPDMRTPRATLAILNAHLAGAPAAA